MGLSISAEQKSIQQVFSGKEIYIIPAYQRTYSWDDRAKDIELFVYQEKVKTKKEERIEIEIQFS